jgi:hypothetical protein
MSVRGGDECERWGGVRGGEEGGRGDDECER